MNKEGKIKDLFAEKLGQLESPVNPELWGKIASQVGVVASTSAAASTGLSVLAKTIIGIGAASVVGVSAYFLTADEKEVSQTTVSEVKPEISLEKETSETKESIISYEEDVPEKNVPSSEKQTTETISVEHVSESSSATTTTNSAVASSTNEGAKTVVTQTESKPVGERVVKSVTPVETPQKDKIKTESNAVPAEIVPSEQVATFELKKLPNIYVMNANGYFSIAYKGEYSDFQFTLMDSKNRVVFSSNQPDFEWRGMDQNGNLVEPGSYIYIITAQDKNGVVINKYSPLTIINQ